MNAFACTTALIASLALAVLLSACGSIVVPGRTAVDEPYATPAPSSTEALPHANHPQASADVASSAASMDAADLGAAIEQIRAATAPFRNLEQAVAAGYSRNGGGCVDNSTHGAMGYHHQNTALMDDVLDIEQPEILTYERTAEGGYELTGVEYIVPFSAWARETPPQILGQPLRREPSLGIWYLHVWVWRDNPSGLFADWNPNVSCGR